MKQVNLHAWDETLWQAPQVRVNVGTYERTLNTFGGRQNKSEQQKQAVLRALGYAVVTTNFAQAIVLAKILEVAYGMDTADMPELLLELQQEELEAA
ncbi:MAG: hypothetical protein KBD66_01620 [Candidatus Doudnabacteria bacterium]|nr:hypothetical protein [Candidatus Doudnabacteria bacterium]